MRPYRPKTFLLLPLLALAALSYTAAFLLRFEFAIPRDLERQLYIGLIVFMAIEIVIFWAFRWYGNHWRMVILFVLCRIVAANLAAACLTWAITPLFAGHGFPRSIYIIDGLLCLLATAGIQFS